MAKASKPSSDSRKPSKSQKLTKEQLAYRALQQNASRQELLPVVHSEDFDLRAQRLPLSWETGLDVFQNLPLVGYGLRTHLNFTSSFEFQPRNGDVQYDQYLKSFFEKYSQKQFVDVRRIHSLKSMYRVWRGLSWIYGDSLASKVQPVEGDKVGKFQLWEPYQLGKGMVDPKANQKDVKRLKAEVDVLNEYGFVVDPDTDAVEFYGVGVGESSAALIHKKLIPWQAAIYDGHIFRPSTSRPASPMLPALNTARDLCDLFQYRLLKAKIEAMICLLVTRDKQKVGPKDFREFKTTANGRPSPPVPGSGYSQIDFRSGMILDWNIGDDAKFLESTAPGKDWLTHHRELCRTILAIWNMPLSMFDSSDATYARSRQDMNLYRTSIREERERNRQSYSEFIDHFLAGAVGMGTLKLPKGVKKVEDIRYELIPQGTFILDPKEIDTILRQVAAGAMTMEDAMHLMETGDFYDVTIRKGKEQKFQQANGVVTVIGLPGQAVPDDSTEDPEPPKDSPKKSKKD